jgi:hypothetical protein
MMGGTLARSGSTLYGLFEFEKERALTDRVRRASVFVDIDLDNNPTTGWRGLKDVVLDSFPEFSSGLGAEVIISLDAHVLADSGFVGVNVDHGEWSDTPLDTFLPGVCGQFFGFHTTAIFGDSIQDDGNFAYAYTAFAQQDTTTAESGAFADPVPLAGSFVADLTMPGPATLHTTPIPPRRVWPSQQRKAPLIRLWRWLRGR